jgi:transposase
MARAHSQDLRDRVIDAALGGMPAQRAAAQFEIGIATAIVWVRRARAPAVSEWRVKASRGAPSSRRNFLLGLVEQMADMTIVEMQQWLAAERSIKASVGTIWTSSTNAGWRSKKSAHAAERDRPDIVKRREAWFEDRLELDPTKLIFIDETCATTSMARRRGRAQKGERLRAGIPQGHWKTTTFVAGLRLTGMTAPIVLDGPMNGAAFLAYVAGAGTQARRHHHHGQPVRS